MASFDYINSLTVPQLWARLRSLKEEEMAILNRLEELSLGQDQPRPEPTQSEEIRGKLVNGKMHC